MTDEETLNRRLRAVERSFSDGDHQVEAMRDASNLADRVSTLESRLDDAEDRIAELEAVTQALRGYVGNVRSLNDDVEQRADAALAAVERLEQRMEGGSSGQSTPHRSPVRRPERDRQQSSAAGSTRTPRASESRKAVDDGASDGEGADDWAYDGEGADDRAAENEADGLVDRVRNAF